MMGSDTDERREVQRRFTDDVRIWLPLVLSLASTILALGFAYGRLGGRLDVIEYRLGTIEKKIP